MPDKLKLEECLLPDEEIRKAYRSCKPMHFIMSINGFVIEKAIAQAQLASPKLAQYIQQRYDEGVGKNIEGIAETIRNELKLQFQQQVDEAVKKERERIDKEIQNIWGWCYGLWSDEDKIMSIKHSDWVKVISGQALSGEVEK